MTTSKLYLNFDDPNVISHLSAISETHKIESVTPTVIDVPETCQRGTDPLSQFSCCLENDAFCNQNIRNDRKSAKTMKGISESLENNYAISSVKGKVTLNGNKIPVCRINDTYHAAHDRNSKDFIDWMSEYKDVKMECGSVILKDVFPTSTIFKNVTNIVDVSTFEKNVEELPKQEKLAEKNDDSEQEVSKSQDIRKLHNVLEIVITKS